MMGIGQRWEIGIPISPKVTAPPSRCSWDNGISLQDKAGYSAVEAVAC